MTVAWKKLANLTGSSLEPAQRGSFVFIMSCISYKRWDDNSRTVQNLRDSSDVPLNSACLNTQNDRYVLWIWKRCTSWLDCSSFRRGRSWVCYCNYPWQLINNWKYIKKALGFDRWLIAYRCRTLKIEKRQQKSRQDVSPCLQIRLFN